MRQHIGYVWAVTFCAFGCLAAGAARGDEPSLPEGNSAPLVEGVIESVTLYRDQALVTRRIEVPAAEGPRELRVGRLPEQVLADSVFAEGDAETEVRAVRVGRLADSTSPRREVVELERRQLELTRSQAALEAQRETLAKAIQDIDRLTQFSQAAGTADLSRGVLDADALTKLVEFSAKSRNELSASNLKLKHELEDLAKELNQVQSELSLIRERPQTAGFEARLTVHSPTGGQVRVSYLVGECGWSPSYTIQGDWAGQRIVLRYNAMVRQMSGEDWPNTNLTLSTASPQVSASGPVLIPFRVSAQTVGPPAPAQAAAAPQRPDSSLAPLQLKEAARGLRQRQAAAESTLSLGFAASDRKSELRRDLMLNSFAGQMQGLELQADSKAVAGLATDDEAEVDSQTYPLEEPVSLDSRREFQLVKIVETPFEAEVYHIAQPLLSSFAYRQAEITNHLEIGLLGGPATVYLDDRFVGRAPLPTTASGQKLTIGLGADQQVRTRRELRGKRDEMQGGNRRIHFEYRLVVANFKSTPVGLRLVDRIPIAENPREVSIQLTPPSEPLSTDPLYLRVQRPRGILRWDLEVAASSFGSQARDIDYDYSVEFDRSKRLATESEESGEFGDDPFGLDPRDRMLLEGSGMGGMGGGFGIGPQ